MKKKRLNKYIKNREGVALVWAMVASIILLLIIVVIFAVTSASYQKTINAQVDTQAYYTARSLNERIVTFLDNTPEIAAAGGLTQAQQLIANVANATNKTIVQEYTAKELGEGLGSGKVTLVMNSRGTELRITSTGYYGDNEETIITKLALIGQSSFTYLHDNFPAQSSSPFTAKDPATGKSPLDVYTARETALNAITPDSSPVVVGNESPPTKKSADEAAYNDNSKDTATAVSVTGNKELTWKNDSNYDEILGTSAWPATDRVDNTNENQANRDVRRFVTPPSGRWAINPLSLQSNIGTSTAPANTATTTSYNNTRLTMLSLGNKDNSDFSGRDLYMRLGGIGTSASSSDTHFYNALIGLDFTDNKDNTTPNPNVEYYDRNDVTKPQSLWHPQNWNSLTLFTQTTDDATINAGVNANIVLGPYAHIYRLSTTYTSFADYWNYGRYSANPWYGQDTGDMLKAFPGNNSASDVAKARYGMSYMPEYFGNDANIYFLDSIDKKAMLLQGVNIIDQNGGANSVIYSRRSLEIGGGLIKTSAIAGPTTRNVNSNVDGIDLGTTSIYPYYPAITARYSQIFYNTDIVLLAPAGQTRSSRIFDATLPADGYYANSDNYSDANNKKFSPTVKIIGGSIYVGAGQTLSIDGGRLNATGSGNSAASPEKTQVIEPDSITVADGGTLTIRGQYDVTGTTISAYSAYANVDTDIYVQGGGTLNLTNARAAGSVHAAGDNGKKAVVNIKGMVTFNPEERDSINAWSGAQININIGTQFTGNIFGGTGSEIVINEPASTSNVMIYGDIYSLGKVTLNGPLALNAMEENLVDDPNTAVNEALPECHGILILTTPEDDAGELVINGTNRVVSGTSGKIHTLVPYSELTGTAANNVFCSNRDTVDNVCKHWTEGGGSGGGSGDDRVWVKQSTTGGG